MSFEERTTETRALPPSSHACILAAHGSQRDSRANALVWEHVARLRQDHGLEQVTAAFHQGAPSFDEALDGIASSQVTVVPFFSAEGHYSRVVLPRKLAQSPRFSEVHLKWVRPVGAHPRMASLLVSRTKRVLEQFDFRPQQTALVVVGHGTRRHPESGTTTWQLVERLEGCRVAREVRAAFLDQSPSLEEVLDQLSSPQLLVVPFLIGGGHHVLQDLPRRAGLAHLSASRFPVHGSIGGREVVVDRAIGEDPGITPLLAELVLDRGGKRPEEYQA